MISQRCPAYNGTGGLGAYPESCPEPCTESCPELVEGLSKDVPQTFKVPQDWGTQGVDIVIQQSH
jgi:hypothetical protein